MKKLLLLSALAVAGLSASANDYFDVKILNGDPIEEGSTITCNVKGEERYKDNKLILVNWEGTVDVNVVSKKGAQRTYAVANCVEPGNDAVADKTKYLSMQICFSNGGANGDENNCLPSTDPSTLYTASSVIAKDNFYWMLESKMRCTGDNVKNEPQPMKVQYDLYACDGTAEAANRIEASKFTFYVQFSPVGAGVEDVIADDVAPVYFDMQGRQVATPEAGLYIVKRGNKVTKEFIR